MLVWNKNSMFVRNIPMFGGYLPPIPPISDHLWLSKGHLPMPQFVHTAPPTQKTNNT